MFRLKHIYKILINILILFISLYSSYLICHVGNYPIKSFIALFIIIFGLLFLIIKFCSKNIDKEVLTKNKKIILFVSTFIISFVIFISNIYFFAYSFAESKINFSSTTSEEINDNFIDYVVINNTIYLYQNNAFIQDFGLKNSSDIKLEKLSNNNYQLLVNKALDVKIEFNDKANNLKLIDGNKNKVINLTSGETLLYNVSNNKVLDNYFLLRCILSFLLIFCLIFIINVSILGTTDKKRRNFICTCLVITIIGYFYRHNLLSNILYPDSKSYVEFNFNKLLHFHLDGRTPIYPIIIRIMYILFSENYFSFVCIFQYIFWFISLIYLYKLLYLLIKNYKLASIFTILYALSPAIITWNNILLTESIALSGTMMFIYYIINYIKTNKLSSGIAAVVISFLLMFERPTAIILVLFLVIFWLFRFLLEKNHLKNDLKCFVFSIISIILLLIYAILFYRDFGIYSISDRAVKQDLYVNIEQEYYKSSNNPQFIKNVEKALDENGHNVTNATWVVYLQYSLKDLKEINSYCRTKNLDKYLLYILDLIKTNSKVKFEGYTYYTVNPDNLWLHDTMPLLFNIITFAHAYIAILIELILLIYRWIKNKKVPWLDCGLFAFPLVIIMSSFIGTNAEFMRTAICCVPFTYISYVLLIYNIINNKSNNS